MCDIHKNEFLELDLHMYIDKGLLPIFLTSFFFKCNSLSTLNWQI